MKVAQKFYGLLVLKKNQAIELTQRQSFDEIYITTGAKFDTPAL
jgi:chromatin segregation and condensation protein Rec8/ScpA/Scc1 (kleisin family)